MKWIGQHIYDYVATFRQGVTMDSTLAVTGNLTFDSVTLTGIQTSSESFVDNDVSLMTSAAIADKIEAYGYSTAEGDITGVVLTADDSNTVSDTGGSADFTIQGNNGISTAIDTHMTISGVNASTSAKGVVELATTAETTTGTDTARAVTPDGLKDGYQGSANITTLGTITTGEWDGDAVTKIGTLGNLAITQGSTGGVDGALTITNQDVDEKALHIDASNTTAAVLNIKAQDLTTANAIYVNCDSLTSGKALRLDVDDALTTSATKTLLDIDYDKAGVTASGQNSETTGISINMADAATNHASGGVSMIGAQIDIDSANAQGTIAQKGLVLNVAADGVADTARSCGIEMEIVDGASDIKMMSHANTADYCTISTTTNGATTIETVDDDAALAHFEIAADGDVTLDAAGTIKLEGPVRQTGQLQYTYHNFTDDIDTTKIYLSLADADTEGTATTGIKLPFTAPLAGKLMRIFLRANQNLSTKTLTWRLETQATGVTFGTGPTIVGTQSGAGCTTSSMTTYDFTSSLDSGDNIIDAGDVVYLSIQSNATTSNTKFYVTCLWEWDMSSIG